MVRVTRTQVQEALASTMPLLTLRDSQVLKLEIEVAPYSPPSPIEPSVFEVNRDNRERDDLRLARRQP